MPDSLATEDVLHDLIAELTGIPGRYVRPRWQPEPPRMPGPDVTWCAFGVTSETGAGTFLVQWPSATGGAASGSEPGTEREGASGLAPARMVTSAEWSLDDHDELEVLLTFYGPGARDSAARMESGLTLASNRKLLREANMALISTGQRTAVPEKFGQQWLTRIDWTLRFRRGPLAGENLVDMPEINGFELLIDARP